MLNCILTIFNIYSLDISPVSLYYKKQYIYIYSYLENSILMYMLEMYWIDLYSK